MKKTKGKDMKRFVALLLSVMMVCCLFTGCAKTEAPAEKAEEPAAAPAEEVVEAPAEEAAPAEEEAAGRDLAELKIGAFSNSTKTDGGYTQAFNTALETIKANYGLKDDQIILVENVYDGTPDVQNIVQQLINEGCNVIIGHSNGYNEDMDVFAQKHDDIQFYCYEGLTSDKITTYSVNNQEAIYLLGYLCAKVSAGDEIGFIAPMQNSHIIRSVDAFALGAKRANENATVRVMWVNSWWDPETDKLCAETLMSEGINTMAYYGSTSAALQACEANGAFCTGFHIDMQSYAPKAVLSSFVWNWVPLLTEMVERYIAEDNSREMIIGGLEMDCARIAPLNADIIDAEIIADVEALQAQIASGEVDVFAGPVYDNQGNLVIEEGATLSEEDLFSVMYLVDNVIGSVE